MARLGLTPRWMLFVGMLAITSVFWLQLCDLVYDCGCRGLWAGAADHCNIHHEPEGSPHRCPWCASTLAGGASFLSVAGWFALSLLRRWPARLAHLTKRQETMARLVVAALAFPIFVFGVGWASGVFMGYWS